MLSIIENKDAVTCSGQQGSILGLRQRKPVAPSQPSARTLVWPVANLLPMGAAIVRRKNSTVCLVVHHSGKQPSRVGTVHQQRFYLAP